MKLLLGVEALGPRPTGIGRLVTELANGLARDPRIELTYWLHNRPISDLDLGQHQAIQAQLPLPLRAVRTRFRNFVAGFRLGNKLYHGPNFFVPAAAQNSLITVHDLSVWKLPHTHPKERVAQFEKAFPRVLEVARHIITPTETIKREVVEYFGWPSDKVSVIGPGVSDAYRPAPERDQPTRTSDVRGGQYTLCVSTVEPRKNIPQLIDAYGALPQRLRDAYPLVLIGDTGWLSESIHERIAQAQREGWLRYWRYVDEPTMVRAFQCARLFVYPSSYEGFGLPIVEAMSCGTPVIAAKASCLPEVADGAAMLVDPNDHETFRQAIERALLDETWRLNAQQLGLLVARRHSWRRTIQRHIDLYTALEI